MIPIPIIGGIIEGISTFFTNKQKIQQAKVEGEIQIIQNAAQNVADWEQLHAKGSQTSWKDEWVLVMFSIPFVVGFIDIPGFNGPQIVADGFAAFAAAPEWYSYTFVSICLASFGIRMKDAMLGKK